MLARKLVAALTILASASPASAVGAQRASATPEVIREYVQRIPAGSRVKVTLTDGKRLRGVLMLVEEDTLLLRERKRRPEPPLRIPIEQVADVAVDQNGGGIGRAIAIGAAVGAGAALAVIAFLAAIISD